MLIQDVKAGGNTADPMRVQNHIGFPEEYPAALQDNGLSPGRVYGVIKHAMTFYRVNRVKIELSEPISRRVTYRDRAPKPEELTLVLEVSNLREKVIVCMLSLGGFTEETLAVLQYHHAREDLENRMTPIHVHV